MTKKYPFTPIKEKLIARQGQMLDFAVGQRSIPLPKSIGRWVRTHAELALKPATRADVDEFARAASAYLKREYRVDIPVECILPTPGGRAAMNAFIACVLSPTDKVLVTEPGYPAFARLAAHRHAEVLARVLNPDNAFLPGFAFETGADTQPLRVIAVNYPNNPTGAILSAEVIARLRKIATAETVVFNDATYGPLVYDEDPQSLLGSDLSGNARRELVELHSFSKLFPLGPVAVSFLAGSPSPMQDIATYSEFAWSPLSQLQLKATTLCLQDETRLPELRKFFPVQLTNLRRTLSEIGLDVFPTPSGTYILCRLPPRIAGKPVHSAESAANRLMEEFDLAVFPLDAPGHAYLRFSSLYRDEDLERLARLGARLQLP